MPNTPTFTSTPGGTPSGARRVSPMLSIVAILAVLAIAAVALGVALGNRSSATSAPTVTTTLAPTNTLTLTYSPTSSVIEMLTKTPSVRSGSGGNSGSSGKTLIDVSGAPEDVVANLNTAGYVPNGGRQLIALDYSFGTTNAVGSDFLSVGQGAQATDLVIQFQVGWDQAGDTSACGMAFRASYNGDHTSALLSNDGQAILYQLVGKKKIIDYSNPTNSMSLEQANTVTVVAIKDTVTMFVNGTLETEQAGKTNKGVFAIEVYNAKGNTVVTNCTYNNIWVWTFDR